MSVHTLYYYLIEESRNLSYLYLFVSYHILNSEQLVVNRHQLSFEFIFLYITRNRTPTAPTEILDPMPSSFGDSY